MTTTQTSIFNLYRGTIGEADSMTLVGIHDTHEAACRDMAALGYGAGWFYMIKEVTAR